MWGNIFSKIVQFVAAGLITMGLEKSVGTFGSDEIHDDTSIIDKAKSLVAVEINRLQSNDKELSSALFEFKIVAFVIAGCIIAYVVITTAMKIYAKLIVKRATKKCIRSLEG